MAIERLRDYIPSMYLEQVLDHCPKAGSTYLKLWKARDNDSRVKVNKEAIREDFLISKAKFNHDLMLLVKEGLISYQINPKELVIELVGWDIDAEGYTLC